MSYDPYQDLLNAFREQRRIHVWQRYGHGKFALLRIEVSVVHPTKPGKDVDTTVSVDRHGSPPATSTHARTYIW